MSLTSYTVPCKINLVALWAPSLFFALGQSKIENLMQNNSHEFSGLRYNYLMPRVHKWPIIYCIGRLTANLVWENYADHLQVCKAMAQCI